LCRVRSRDHLSTKVHLGITLAFTQPTQLIKKDGSVVGDHGGIARDAAARQEWADAYAAYCKSDATDLGPNDLEAFADAAWWTSRLEESLELRRRAFAAYQDARAPRRAGYCAWFLYETAHAHMLLGQASRAAGDEERARLEFAAARSTFEQLKAKRDAGGITVLLNNAPAPGGLSAREAEVLRLVAKGKTNRQIAFELSLSEHTVSRHLQNIFTKLGISSRAAATAFAYQHGLA
jgi:DNA-binding NarL/FixJ family response regulator